MNRKTVISVLLGLIAGGALLAGVASRSDAGSGRPNPPEASTAKEVSRKEITRPGDHQVYAIFQNGTVYRAHAKTRTYVVHKDDGTDVARVEEEKIELDDGSALPPVDPALPHVGPSPAQQAEMNAITGMGPNGEIPFLPPPQP